MKLTKLSCNDSSFRTINFNRSGLTLILGKKSERSQEISSVNGVGKTQAMRLIHFCLGASNTNDISKTLKHAVPSWVFRLDFMIQDRENYIERSGDSKYLRLNGEDVSHKALVDWLDSSKTFPQINERKFITFRSLFSRFARVRREDSLDPIRLYKEPEYASLINTAYLLNVDLDLIEQKYKLKSKLDTNKSTKRLLSQDSYLAETFKTGTNPSSRKKVLEKNIAQLNQSLVNFSIADDYHEIEKEAEILTNEGREIQREISALSFKIEGIEKSSKQTPDIDNEQLLQLYEGLRHLFRPEVLDHFEAVQEFHKELTVNRITRLEKEKISLKIRIDKLKNSFNYKSRKRDEKLLFLRNNHALDEYLGLTEQLTTYKEELTHLDKYLSLDTNITEQNLQLKTQIIEVISRALEYEKTDPLAELNSKFQNIISMVYPRLSSSVVMDVIESEDNKSTYGFSVDLETDSSDGVAAVKILAFDWLVYQYGYHNMQMLWHDNRLFADIDPEELARWFEFVATEMEDSDKQYIASININNYQEMEKSLPAETLYKINKSITLTLEGDTPSNKLMGINFDKPRKKTN